MSDSRRLKLLNDNDDNMNTKIICTRDAYGNVDVLNKDAFTGFDDFNDALKYDIAYGLVPDTSGAIYIIYPGIGDGSSGCNMFFCDQNEKILSPTNFNQASDKYIALSYFSGNGQFTQKFFLRYDGAIYFKFYING